MKSVTAEGGTTTRAAPGAPLARSDARAIGVRVAQMAALALAYAVVARLSLSLSVAYGNATPVWPPTGIALGVLLLFGRGLWPGVAVGAFVANVTTDAGPASSAAIALGNTLESVLAVTLLHKVGGFDRRLVRVRDVAAFVAVAAVLASAISATIGVSALRLGGDLPAGGYGYAWSLWWSGDATGALLVAPLLIVWVPTMRAPRALRGRATAEAAGLAVGLGAACWIAFFAGRWSFPLALFPVLVLAALRFRQHGATLATFVTATVAIGVALGRTTPIVGSSPATSVAMLQALLGVSAVTLLILAATIAERERLEIAAARAREEMEEAQSLGQIGSWNWDATTDTVSWSAVMLNIFGLTAPPADIAAAIARVHPDDRARGQAALEETLRAPGPFALDLRIVRSDGAIRWVHVEGRTAEDAPPVRRLSGVAQDITERKAAESMREAFIANAAHELRTPVTAVHGFSEMLWAHRHRPEGPEVEEALGALRRQGARLSALVTSLLDYTRIDASETMVPVREVQPAKVIRRTLRELPPPSGRRVDVAVPEHVRLLADEQHLDQIVVNLLANAYRYGGRNIRIEAVERDHHAELLFADDGPGVPPAFMSSVFEPFTRGLHASDQVGSGLGLSIVRSLVRSMGGSVRYEPGIPAGARFVVCLRRVG